MITQDIACEIFEYNSESGLLSWKIKNGNRGLKGRTAGHVMNNGYRSVSINGRPYLVHRLVWLIHNGYVPENDIDHINRIRSDNRIENLREVSRMCNARNTCNFKHNTSGVKGVYWDKSKNKWKSYLIINGKVFNFGNHDSFEEAVFHRLAAEQCVDWDGCDSSSPAFKYVQKFLKK